MLQSKTTNSSSKISARRKTKDTTEDDFSIEHWSRHDVDDLMTELDIKPRREYSDYNQDFNNWLN